MHNKMGQSGHGLHNNVKTQFTHFLFIDTSFSFFLPLIWIQQGKRNGSSVTGISNPVLGTRINRCGPQAAQDLAHNLLLDKIEKARIYIIL